MQSKEIRLKIAKIYHWPSEEPRVSLSLDFYSDHNQSLLASRMVRAVMVTDYLEVGVSLKIRYTPEEKKINIAVKRPAGFSRNQKAEVFGEVTINLDEVQQSKVKFYNLGERGQILEVELAECRRSRIQFEEPRKRSNQKKIRDQVFLQERKKFMSKVNNNDVMLRKAFSQKIFTLLNSPINSRPLTIAGKLRFPGQQMYEIDSAQSKKEKESIGVRTLGNFDQQSEGKFSLHSHKMLGLKPETSKIWKKWKHEE